MKKKMRQMLGCLAVAIAVIAVAGATVQPTPPAGGIAVVDIPQVFTGYQKWLDICKYLEDREGIQQDELDKLGAELEALEKKMAGQDPKSDAFNTLQAEVIKKQTYLTTLARQYEHELQRTEMLRYEEVFQEIQKAIAAAAEDSRLSMVIQKTLELPDGFWESVIYVRKECNLTAPIIAGLNASYAKTK